MKYVDIATVLKRSRGLLLEFCEVEISLANTLLDRVDTDPADPSHRASFERARQASSTVAQFLANYSLSGPEAENLRLNCDLLEKRIAHTRNAMGSRR